MTSKSTAIIHTSDGDQRPHESDGPSPTRYEEGTAHSHVAHDSKDERSIANKLGAASSNETNNRKAGKDDNPDLPDPGMGPADLARKHGNEPSKGAKIDEQLALEEEAELRKKGKA